MGRKRSAGDATAARDAPRDEPGGDVRAPAGPPAGGPVRLLLVDADRRVLAGLVALLELSPAVTVVATAGDVRGAVDACARTAPDAIVVDPRLPEIGDGVAFITTVRADRPAIRIIALAWSNDLDPALGPDLGVSVVPMADGESDLGERVIALALGTGTGTGSPGKGGGGGGGGGGGEDARVASGKGSRPGRAARVVLFPAR